MLKYEQQQYGKKALYSTHKKLYILHLGTAVLCKKYCTQVKLKLSEIYRLDTELWKLQKFSIKLD